MKTTSSLRLAAIGGIVLVACASVWAADNSASQIPTSGDKVDGAPLTVVRDWGTFTLSPKIAEKIKNKEKINYVFSYQASGNAVFSPQMEGGFKFGCGLGQAILPMNCAIIAPIQNNANEQISQIEAKLAAGEIDCFSVQPPSADGATAVINKMMSKGIPAFTVGLPSGGHEFSNFTQIPIKEGIQAAEIVLKWMKDSGNDLKVFAVSGGDPSQDWAQGRLKGFHETIMKAIPEAKFVTTEENAINTSFVPAKTFDTYKAFLLGHPEVQFIENVDVGAEFADRAITELNRAGKVFTIGWNSSLGQLDAIEAGTQVALLDQRWPDQAAFGGAACAQFLANGVILPNAQSLRPIFKADVPRARKELASVLKTGN
jgi:ABC-type sugar transport system substrate-binding protein